MTTLMVLLFFYLFNIIFIIICYFSLLKIMTNLVEPPLFFLSLFSILVQLVLVAAQLLVANAVLRDLRSVH